MEVTGTSGFPTPQIQMDSTPAADPFVQQLLAENAKLRAERDQLASINARLSRKLATLRDGVAVLAERIKSERK